MDIRKLARAMLAWAKPPSRRSPQTDRARIRGALKTKLPPHLLKDIGAGDG
jgi:hypothetical protein